MVEIDHYKVLGCTWLNGDNACLLRVEDSSGIRKRERNYYCFARIWRAGHSRGKVIHGRMEKRLDYLRDEEAKRSRPQ